MMEGILLRGLGHCGDNTGVFREWHRTKTFNSTSNENRRAL
jgi:hypothetical protein